MDGGANIPMHWATTSSQGKGSIHFLDIAIFEVTSKLSNQQGGSHLHSTPFFGSLTIVSFQF
jgi:hypothetical protein